MNKAGIKVLIADDHDLIRQGLKRIIEFEDDIVITGEADNGEKVLTMLKQYNPDVLLLDRNMPKMDGIEVLKKVKGDNSGTKVIMLTVEKSSKTIDKAIEIGADGYLLKESAGTDIVDAIRTVHKGEKYIDKSLVSLLFSGIKSKSKKISGLDILSQREVEVLLKILKGFSNKEIGDQLYLSEKTVKNYATNLFRKINAHDRVHATIFAIENGIEEYYIKKFGDVK